MNVDWAFDDIKKLTVRCDHDTVVMEGNTFVFYNYVCPEELCRDERAWCQGLVLKLCTQKTEKEKERGAKEGREEWGKKQNQEASSKMFSLFNMYYGIHYTLLFTFV